MGSKPPLKLEASKQFRQSASWFKSDHASVTFQIRQTAGQQGNIEVKDHGIGWANKGVGISSQRPGSSVVIDILNTPIRSQHLNRRKTLEIMGELLKPPKTTASH